MFLPQEIIDHILSYLPVKYSISLHNEYTKKKLLKNINLDHLWRSDSFDALKFLIKYNVECNIHNIIDFHCRKGNLEIVKLLNENGKDCTTDAMDYAAEKGHLEIVIYLYENGKDCTTDAMDYASQNGHLDIVKYLYEMKY